MLKSQRKGNKIKCSGSNLLFDIIVTFLMILLLIIVVYPLYFIVIASFSDATAVANGQVVLWPKGVSLDGYRSILFKNEIWIGYKNTIIYTVLGTLINLFMILTVAYPLSIKNFSGRKFIMVFLLITMYFNGGLVPTYMVVKWLGLVNHWPVMIILGAVSGMNVIIAKNFMETGVPRDLYESSIIDGCSHFTYFSRILLPLSKPIIAVLALYCGVGHWNSYMTGLIYLNKPDQQPLQLIIRSILVETQKLVELAQNGNAGANVMEDMMRLQNEAEMMKYAVIVVSSVPVLLIYPFLQKYFVQGTMIGAVKG